GSVIYLFHFFVQAEDGIRVRNVTGVQTCALPISTIIISLAIALIIMIIVNFFRTVFSIKIIYRFSWHLMSGAFTRVLSLPAKYFTVRSPGEIIYRLNSLTRIQDVLGTSLVQACLDLISGVAILVYVFLISPLLGIMILLFISATFVFLII